MKTINQIQEEYKEYIIKKIHEYVLPIAMEIIQRKTNSIRYTFFERMILSTDILFSYFSKEEIIKEIYDYLNSQIKDFSKYYIVDIVLQPGNRYDLFIKKFNND